MKVAVGYIRVSTIDQATEGVSLPAQREKIESWAKLNGILSVRIFQDSGISGKSVDNRSGLQEAIQASCEAKAVLIVYSLSRMSRSTKDTLVIAEELEKAGADLVSLSEKIDTTTAAGKMVFRMLAVLAEFERDLISERTRGALAHIRAQGRKTGGDVPYGYDHQNGKLIENETEVEAINEINKMHQKGMGLRPICAGLNSGGYKTKNGNSVWHPNQVARIIKRTFVAV